MIDRDTGLTIEEKTTTIDLWFTNVNKSGWEKMPEIDRLLLKDVLQAYGANFENAEELRLLKQYTNKAKRPGLDAVWGKEFVDDFWTFIGNYINDYEDKKGKPLPALKKSRKKFSGFRQFFGELTAFAAGQITDEQYYEYTRSRLFNGKMWQEDRREERMRVQVPTVKDPILLSSVPPEFPVAAWEFIKNIKEDK
jgi:hypothetical protein